MLGQTKRLITLHPFSPRLGDLMYFVTSDQIEQQFNSMSDLKNDVAGGKTTKQSSISTFLSSKRPVPDTPSVEPVPKIPLLASPFPEERNIVLFLPKELEESVGYFPIKPHMVMKVMRVSLTHIAMTWRRRGNSLHLYWDTEIASHGVIDKYLPTICRNVKAMLKCLTSLFTDYSFSCDCWSTLKTGFKAVCFFLHVYFENQYYSFLLDVVPIEDGSAFSIDESFKRICGVWAVSESPDHHGQRRLLQGVQTVLYGALHQLGVQTPDRY